MFTPTLFLILIQLFLAAAIFNKKSIIISLLSIIIMLISSTQLSSFIFTGNLIEPLALTNLESLEKVGYFPLIIFAISLFSISIVTLLFQKINNRKIIAISFILILLTSFLINSPIGGAINTVKLVYAEYKLIEEAEAAAKAIGVKNETKNTLIKNKVVYGNSSYKQKLEEKKYNIITIFVEGMSYDVISEKSTPNLYKLMGSSITLKNYFNHTAATFRGLRGQLTSSYQISGGYTKQKSGIGQMSKDKILEQYQDEYLISLPSILKKNGYTAYFQAANAVDHPLSIMLSTLGFDKIFGILDAKNVKETPHNALTDKDSIALMSQKIKELKPPFFYGMYTVGTHLGFDSPDQRYKNGNNEYLNKFYNIDFQIGAFIDDFNNSHLAKDTIIIITSDHSSYPNPDFINTFKTKSNYFVDRIPFMIYKKGLEPSVLNVSGINTLSIAPTILDIVGIKNAKNTFLGMSVFDKYQHPNMNYISAIGFKYYITSEEGVEQLESDDEIIDKVQKMQIYGG